MKEFSETEAVKAMRAALPADAPAGVDDDELLNLLDIIWDWYDDNGYLDIDADIDSEPDTEALIAHVGKMIRKDKDSPLKDIDIRPLVEAELAYEQSLEDFD